MTARLTARRRLGAAIVLIAAAGLLPGASELASAGAATAPARGAAQLAASPKAPGKPAVIDQRVIGYSVNHHAIRAWELGDKDADITAVVFARHHGNEPAGTVVLDTLRDGNPVHGIDLWVVPRLNPDGALRNTRQNAHGVDLNRNFPWHWRRVTGYYNSGPHPASEPETRTAMRFLNRIDPDYVVSFHTPLHGLDVTHAKDKALARRLSRDLRLPNHPLQCQGGCHGTLSEWFNHAHEGACVTVEFGYGPSEQYLTVTAPRGLVRALGGTRGP